VPAPSYTETDPAMQPWVVVDCETTGFDEKKDVLLSIAAVKLRGSAIAVEDCFHQLLRPDTVSATSNVLVHGIGHAQQNAAEDPAKVLAAFRDFAGAAPMIGFHAGFDAKFLRAAFARHQVEGWQPLVLDCAILSPLLLGAHQAPKDLDGWLARFGIEPLARHDALSDAWCTAQLWQVLLAEGRKQGCETVSHWQRKIKQARELEQLRM